MNRRKKKVQQVDYSELMMKKLSQVNWRQIPARVKQVWLQLPKRHQQVLMVLVPVVLFLVFLPTPSSDPAQPEAQSETLPRVQVDIDTQGLSEQPSQLQESLASDVWEEYRVKKGDTLAQVFRNNDLAMSDLNALVRVEGSDKPLSYIKAGQLVRFKLAEDGSLDILQLEKSTQSVMFFRLSDGAFGRSK
ncbi:LysM-like peptidoglycan-binding domain-containing protein [Vibrio ostreicida]|uniref:LysM-like peptidoglycan-binding domain-containing protein n=1 Tax=Vibrio ostreicida TaxID=526588 RepID=UPI00097040E8|nr:LysM-like peptidoglycan-binding domain-containing protein [Vibrio ostreicida]